MIGAASSSKWPLIKRVWKRLSREISKPASRLRSPILLRYQLTSTTDGEEFTTDAGVQYVVYFSEAAAYFPGFAAAPHAFMLGFMRRDKASQLVDIPAHDPRIRETIVYVVAQFFEDERRVLAYVCQQGPQEQARHRLFAAWFRQHSHGQFIRRVVGEEHGLAAAVIYRQTNPFAQELQQLPSMEDKFRQ